MKFTLELPKETGFEKVSTSQNLMIIGANGSGKTRLGTWIEFNSQQKEKVHRISAQKSLSMPENTKPVSIDSAEKELLYGYVDSEGKSHWNYKEGNRWNKKPAISLLNDYEKLMVFLF